MNYLNLECKYFSWGPVTTKMAPVGFADYDYNSVLPLPPGYVVFDFISFVGMWHAPVKSERKRQKV